MNPKSCVQRAGGCPTRQPLRVEIANSAERGLPGNVKWRAVFLTLQPGPFMSTIVKVLPHMHIILCFGHMLPYLQLFAW